MSKRHLQKAIENPEEQVRNSSNNLLGRIYWTLIPKLNLTITAFYQSLNRFVRDPRNVPEQTAQKRSYKTSNITTEMTNPKRMTWRKFIEALRAIEIVRIRVTVEVWRGKREVYAKTAVEMELSDVDVSTNDKEETKE